MTRKLRARYLRRGVVYFLTYCMIVNTWLPAALATPAGGVFTSGTGTIVEGANTAVTVNQAQSIIQWGTAPSGGIPGTGGIDTAAGESLTFLQADGLSNSAVLNRIMSGNPTQFDGLLNGSDMRIFIVNPAGIVFGGTSQVVNVNQLVASSLGISNENFLTGHYEFIADGAAGAVTNNGEITAAQGAALIGQKVLNAGTITTTNPGGFVVMAAGNRVLLGEPLSNVIVEMDSVTPATPENPEGLGDVTNESTGSISAPAGTIVLAAGDMFSTALRVESGVGRVVQKGTIHADGTTGATADGGSVTLTAGDTVVLGGSSLTTANSGVSNSGANGGEVIAYASELYKDNALTDFQKGAQIQVRGGAPSDTATVDIEAATFAGGLAEISGDHLYFNGSVDATSTPYQVPDPANPGSFITVTPEGGTLHIDPVNLTLADGDIPAGGALIDTFYEKQLEAYSQAGVNTILEADYDITVEYINDGVIQGDRGDIVLRTAYNTGGIEFLPVSPGSPINTIIKTVAGGNIFMLAGSGGIKTGHLQTYEDGGNPGRIRIYTNNGGDIQTRSLTVDGGNDVEVSVIASGDLTINGKVVTSTNKVPAEEDQTGTAYICLVSETGSINVLGAVSVEAHGKEKTVAQIHICADNTVTVHTGNDRLQATAKTSSAGTAEAAIRVHAGSEDPGAISITRNSGSPVRIQAYTSGSTINQDFTGALVDPEYTQTSGGSEVLVHIANAWLSICPDCPTPPDLPPPVQPPQHAPIAVDDGYTIGKGAILLIILDADGVLDNDSDPDGDAIIALLLGGGTTDKGGTVILLQTGGFEYTPPETKQFDTFGSDAEGDYALFIDTFEYNLQDEGGLNSNSATVTITAKNYIPVAQADNYEVVHNVSLSPTAVEGIITGVVPAINGDSDYDGDSLTPYLPGGTTTGSTALGGTITLNSDGSFAYTPPADTVGTDSFMYYASDGYNNSGSVQVTIELTNTAPVAKADSYDVVHNVNLTPAVEQGVIQGALPEYADSDPDPGDTLTAVLVNGGSTLLGGTVTLNDDGSFTYTPPANTVGTDSFSYYVSDNYDATSEPVLVTINLTNTLPVARPDSYTVGFNTSLSPTADQGIITGVVPAINGDYDPDPGDSLTPFLPGGLTTGATAQGGTVTLNADGSFTYTPATGWVGADSFTYYVTDSYGNSEPVLVTVLVGTAPSIPPAPGLERVEIVTSGCPALMAWAAAELGTDQSSIQIGIANALASGMSIQACNACAGLKQAAIILQDAEGTYIAALAQVINEFASSTAPPSEEQMTSIANAIAQNVGTDNQYAVAGEYLDALASYVGILNSEMGFSAEEAIQLATDKYVAPLAEGQNAGLAAYVAARLTALGGS